ncbi:MAG TPA: hypothetical protein VGE21_11385 [Flavobacteriales bacterium]
MKLLRNPGVWSVLLLSILVGSVREFLFINLNYQIDHVQRGTRFSYAHSKVQAVLSGVDLGTLQFLKWTVAVVFIAAGAALCSAMDRAMQGSWRHTKAIVLTFVAVAALAFGLHLLAAVVPRLSTVSIQTLHMLQYPVPVLFVLLAGMLPLRRSASTGGR